ncbi:MAG: hypothetical protein HUJ74_01235 [Lachnospiraceae bacterium]|nr:hypothetical protein [Lachnospiraceae bacterium]
MCKRKLNSRKVFKRIRLFIAGVVVLMLLLYFWLFYIKEVEVIGNIRYTKKEVENIVLDDCFAHNSVFLSTFQKYINLNDIPFIEAVNVEYLNRNKIRLYVHEKHPIGYVREKDIDYYLDKDSLVLESLSVRDLQSTDDDNSLAIESFGENDQTENGGSINGSKMDIIDFPSTWMNVPMITGLHYESVVIGEILSMENPFVYSTILTLIHLINKYELQPDSIEFTENQLMTLHYEQVRISLGTDIYLQEKMIRIASILPKLSGMSGVLHLEDFTNDIQSIIFEQD